MSWTKEDRLLFYSCQIKIGGRDKNALMEKLRDIDWDCFLEKARQEGVSPLVFLRLPEVVGDWGSVPLSVMEGLKKDYYATAARNSLVFEELGRVLEGFNRVGLDAIVLKGAALAETVYGNLALRPMYDVDLLVRKGDLYQIDNELKRFGYFSYDGAVDDIDPFSPAYLTSLLYQNSSRNSLAIHIHWHFVNSTIPNEYYIRNIKIEDIWQDAEKTDIAGVEMRVMAPHHLLLHLSEHAFKHSLGRLSLFCDIDETINCYQERLDWDRLIKDSFKFGLNRMVYLALYFTSRFLGAGVPGDVLLKLRPERFSLYEKIFIKLVSSNHRFYGMGYLVHLSGNKGISEKARFVLRTFFPPRHFIARRLMISQEKVSPIFYLRRTSEVFFAFARAITRIFRASPWFHPKGTY